MCQRDVRSYPVFIVVGCYSSESVCFLCVSAVCLEIAQHAAHGAKANEHIVRWRIEDQARASHQVIKYRALANRQVTIASTKALFVRSPLNAISFGQYLLFC